MNLPRFICPDNKDLLRTFSGRTVAVRVKSPGNAVRAASLVRESGNDLFCIIIESRLLLGEMEFPEDLKGIPLAVMAPSLGKFRNLVNRLNLLRSFNLRVYLPCDQPDNLTGLRILSSVGINSCAVFANGRTDWEALTDLMTYAVLGQAPHAPIEPFLFIASHYDPLSHLEWGSIYFDDPSQFLHVDAKGRVALSYSELGKKRFIARSISEIEGTAELPAIKERRQAWRHLFLENHPCASCGGFKVCLGRFSTDASQDKGCSAFFMEMIEVARQHKARDVQTEECLIWQP